MDGVSLEERREGKSLKMIKDRKGPGKTGMGGAKKLTWKS